MSCSEITSLQKLKRRSHSISHRLLRVGCSCLVSVVSLIVSFDLRTTDLNVLNVRRFDINSAHSSPDSLASFAPPALSELNVNRYQMRSHVCNL